MKFIFLLLSLMVAQVYRLATPRDMRVNEIQVIGSHNSYKKAIDPALFRMFQQKDSVAASKIDYEHIPLVEQLDMGLLNLEIDVYSDEKGGRYAHPKGLDWVKGQPAFDPEGVMNEPGFKVFHIPDLDFRSDGLTLKNELQSLRAWSEKHPDHNPVFITLEPKDNVPANSGLTVPEKFTEETLEELDKSLVDNLGMKHLLTPDMVRGQNKTLESAVLDGHWPTVKAARGKFIFIMDNTKAIRDLYIAGHPSLTGRILFVNAEAGTPEAACLIINDPVTESDRIQQLVKKGYIIRTRADSDTREARRNDKTHFEAACHSGAQIISTDYYRKSTHFVSDYTVHFDDGGYFRSNPVNNQHGTGH